MKIYELISDSFCDKYLFNLLIKYIYNFMNNLSYIVVKGDKSFDS